MARTAGRPATMIMTRAPVQSLSVVTEAGGNWLNRRLAIPAPVCTDTAPASTRPAGSAAGAVLARRRQPGPTPMALGVLTPTGSSGRPG